ncbi:MAG: GNAT family N-acetyltransferase [Endomicrobiales bacterium]|nr:GNAT family N-acetyltransferase [Endomicrobiales bacterium]
MFLTNKDRWAANIAYELAAPYRAVDALLFEKGGRVLDEIAVKESEEARLGKGQLLDKIEEQISRLTSQGVEREIEIIKIVQDEVVEYFEKGLSSEYMEFDQSFIDEAEALGIAPEVLSNLYEISPTKILQNEHMACTFQNIFCGRILQKHLGKVYAVNVSETVDGDQELHFDVLCRLSNGSYYLADAAYSKGSGQVPAELLKPGEVESVLSESSVLSKNLDKSRTSVHPGLRITNFSNGSMCSIWNSFGKFYDAVGERDKSLEAFNRALRFNPKHALVYLNRGINYLYRNEFNAAEQNFIGALAINPGYVSAWENLKVTYELSKQNKKAEKANKYMQMAQRGEPVNLRTALADIKAEEPGQEMPLTPAMLEGYVLFQYGQDKWDNWNQLEPIERQKIEAEAAAWYAPAGQEQLTTRETLKDRMRVTGFPESIQEYYRNANTISLSQLANLLTASISIKTGEKSLLELIEEMLTDFTGYPLEVDVEQDSSKYIVFLRCTSQQVPEWIEPNTYILAEPYPSDIIKPVHYHGTSHVLEILSSGKLAYRDKIHPIFFTRRGEPRRTAYSFATRNDRRRSDKIKDWVKEVTEIGDFASFWESCSDERRNEIADTIQSVSCLTLANEDCSPFSAVLGFTSIPDISERGTIERDHDIENGYEGHGRMTEISFQTQNDMELFLTVLTERNIALPRNIVLRIRNDEGDRYVASDKFKIEIEAAKGRKRQLTEFEQFRNNVLLSLNTGKEGQRTVSGQGRLTTRDTLKDYVIKVYGQKEWDAWDELAPEERERIEKEAAELYAPIVEMSEISILMWFRNRASWPIIGFIFKLAGDWLIKRFLDAHGIGNNEARRKGLNFIEERMQAPSLVYNLEDLAMVISISLTGTESLREKWGVSEDILDSLVSQHRQSADESATRVLARLIVENVTVGVDLFPDLTLKTLTIKQLTNICAHAAWNLTHGPEERLSGTNVKQIRSTEEDIKSLPIIDSTYPDYKPFNLPDVLADFREGRISGAVLFNRLQHDFAAFTLDAGLSNDLESAWSLWLKRIEDATEQANEGIQDKKFVLGTATEEPRLILGEQTIWLLNRHIATDPRMRMAEYYLKDVRYKTSQEEQDFLLGQLNGQFGIQSNRKQSRTVWCSWNCGFCGTRTKFMQNVLKVTTPMKTEEMKGIIRQAHKSGYVKDVYLLGEETLDDRESLFEIVDACNELGLGVTLTSNGVYFLQDAERTREFIRELRGRALNCVPSYMTDDEKADMKQEGYSMVKFRFSWDMAFVERVKGWDTFKPTEDDYERFDTTDENEVRIELVLERMLEIIDIVNEEQGIHEHQILVTIVSHDMEDDGNVNYNFSASLYALYRPRNPRFNFDVLPLGIYTHDSIKFFGSDVETLPFEKVVRLTALEEFSECDYNPTLDVATGQLSSCNTRREFGLRAVNPDNFMDVLTEPLTNPHQRHLYLSEMLGEKTGYNELGLHRARFFRLAGYFSPSLRELQVPTGVPYSYLESIIFADDELMTKINLVFLLGDLLDYHSGNIKDSFELESIPAQLLDVLFSDEILDAYIYDSQSASRRSATTTEETEDGPAQETQPVAAGDIAIKTALNSEMAKEGPADTSVYYFGNYKEEIEDFPEDSRRVAESLLDQSINPDKRKFIAQWERDYAQILSDMTESQLESEWARLTKLLAGHEKNPLSTLTAKELLGDSMQVMYPYGFPEYNMVIDTRKKTDSYDSAAATKDIILTVALTNICMEWIARHWSSEKHESIAGQIPKTIQPNRNHVQTFFPNTDDHKHIYDILGSISEMQIQEIFELITDTDPSSRDQDNAVRSVEIQTLDDLVAETGHSRQYLESQLEEMCETSGYVWSDDQYDISQTAKYKMDSKSLKKSFLLSPENEIVGFLIYYYTANTCNANLIIINEDFRRRGYATKLLLEAADVAIQEGLGILELQVDSFDDDVLEFYRSFEQRYYPNTGDSIHYHIKRFINLKFDLTSPRASEGERPSSELTASAADSAITNITKQSALVQSMKEERIRGYLGENPLERIDDIKILSANRLRDNDVEAIEAYEVSTTRGSYMIIMEDGDIKTIALSCTLIDVPEMPSISIDLSAEDYYEKLKESLLEKFSAFTAQKTTLPEKKGKIFSPIVHSEETKEKFRTMATDSHFLRHLIQNPAVAEAGISVAGVYYFKQDDNLRERGAWVHLAFFPQILETLSISYFQASLRWDDMAHEIVHAMFSHVFSGQQIDQIRAWLNANHGNFLQEVVVEKYYPHLAGYLEYEDVQMQIASEGLTMTYDSFIKPSFDSSGNATIRLDNYYITADDVNHLIELGLVPERFSPARFGYQPESIIDFAYYKAALGEMAKDGLGKEALVIAGSVSSSITNHIDIIRQALQSHIEQEGQPQIDVDEGDAAATIPFVANVLKAVYKLLYRIGIKGVPESESQEAMDAIIFKWAPIVESGLFGIFYLASVAALSLLGGNTVLSQILINAAQVGSYFVLNLIFGAMHTSVYRFAVVPGTEERIYPSFAWQKIPASWQVRMKTAFEGMKMHAPYLIPGVGLSFMFSMSQLSNIIPLLTNAGVLQFIGTGAVILTGIAGVLSGVKSVRKHMVYNFNQKLDSIASAPLVYELNKIKDYFEKLHEESLTILDLAKRYEGMEEFVQELIKGMAALENSVNEVNYFIECISNGVCPKQMYEIGSFIIEEHTIKSIFEEIPLPWKGNISIEVDSKDDSQSIRTKINSHVVRNVILKELFTNTLKYAESNIDISVNVDNTGQVVITISNDIKKDIDFSTITSGEVGLPLTGRAVELVGGDFSVTQDENRFTATVTLPAKSKMRLTPQTQPVLLDILIHDWMHKIRNTTLTVPYGSTQLIKMNLEADAGKLEKLPATKIEEVAESDLWKKSMPEIIEDVEKLRKPLYEASTNLREQTVLKQQNETDIINSILAERLKLAARLTFDTIAVAMNLVMQYFGNRFKLLNQFGLAGETLYRTVDLNNPNEVKAIEKLAKEEAGMGLNSVNIGFISADETDPKLFEELTTDSDLDSLPDVPRVTINIEGELKAVMPKIWLKKDSGILYVEDPVTLLGIEAENTALCELARALVAQQLMYTIAIDEQNQASLSLGSKIIEKLNLPGNKDNRLLPKLLVTDNPFMIPGTVNATDDNSVVISINGKRCRFPYVGMAQENYNTLVTGVLHDEADALQMSDEIAGVVNRDGFQFSDERTIDVNGTISSSGKVNETLAQNYYESGAEQLVKTTIGPAFVSDSIEGVITGQEPDSIVEIGIIQETKIEELSLIAEQQLANFPKELEKSPVVRITGLNKASREGIEPVSLEKWKTMVEGEAANMYLNEHPEHAGWSNEEINRFTLPISNLLYAALGETEKMKAKGYDVEWGYHAANTRALDAIPRLLTNAVNAGISRFYVDLNDFASLSEDDFDEWFRSMKDIHEKHPDVTITFALPETLKGRDKDVRDVRGFFVEYAYIPGSLVPVLEAGYVLKVPRDIPQSEAAKLSESGAMGYVFSGVENWGRIMQEIIEKVFENTRSADPKVRYTNAYRYGLNFFKKRLTKQDVPQLDNTSLRELAESITSQDRASLMDRISANAQFDEGQLYRAKRKLQRYFDQNLTNEFDAFARGIWEAMYKESSPQVRFATESCDNAYATMMISAYSHSPENKIDDVPMLLARGDYNTALSILQNNAYKIDLDITAEKIPDESWLRFVEMAWLIDEYSSREEDFSIPRQTQKQIQSTALKILEIAAANKYNFPEQLQALLYSSLIFGARLDRKKANEWEKLAEQIRPALRNKIGQLREGKCSKEDLKYFSAYMDLYLPTLQQGVNFQLDIERIIQPRLEELKENPAAFDGWALNELLIVMAVYERKPPDTILEQLKNAANPETFQSALFLAVQHAA